MAASAPAFELMNFWRIVVTEGNEDETEILRYAITSICPIGADVKHATAVTRDGLRTSSPPPVRKNAAACRDRECWR